MARLVERGGDNTPPPLIPPPLGYAGQGDAYSALLDLPGSDFRLGAPVIPPIGRWPGATPVMRGIGTVLDTAGKFFIPDEAALEARRNIVPKVFSGQELSETERNVFIAALPFAGMKKVGSGVVGKLITASDRYVVKDANVINSATGLLHSAQPDAAAAKSVALRLNAVPDLPAGLGGTGGQAPLPPGGPKFSGDQFPKAAIPGLNVIQAAPGVVRARPTIGLSEQQAIADRLANQPAGNIIARLRASGAGMISGPSLEADRRVAGMIQESAPLLEAIQNGTATVQQQAQLELMLRSAVELRAAKVGAVSEGMRAGGAQGRIPIEAKLREPDKKLLEVINAQKNEVLSDPAKRAEFARMLLVASSSPKKLSALLDATEGLSFWKKAENGFFEYYRASVLWNPATHITNASSGLFQQLGSTAEKVIQNPANIKYTPEILKGYVQSAVSHAPSQIRDWLGARIGIFDDLPEQIALMGQSPKFGGDIVTRNTIPGALGAAIRTPYSLLSASDVFQTKPMYNFFLKTEARSMGRAQGLKGGALDSFVDNIPPDVFNQISEKALSLSHESALHATGPFQKSLLALREANFAGKLTLLFVNTPVNLAIRGLRYSPLGAVRAVPASLTGAGRERIPGIAREALIGSGIMAGFSALLASDNMTGLSPKTAAERTLWEAEGRQPMSIRATEYPIISGLLKLAYGDKAKDTWVTANLMGPLVYPALLAAALNELGRNGEPVTEKQILAASGAAGQTILNTVPLFSQYNNINSVLANPTETTVANLIANYLKPLIPAESALAVVERMMDGFRRDPKDIGERLKVIIPFAGEQVRQKYDVLGRPLTVGTGVPGLFPKSTTETPSPILDEARRLRDANPGWSGLGPPRSSFGTGDHKIDLNPDQNAAYQKIAGEAKQQMLGALINDPKYQQLSNAEKAKKFDSVENQAQNSALRALGIGMTTSPDINEVVTGARLAISTGDRYTQAKSLAAVGKNLTPEVVRGIDSARIQTDPAKDSYDPTVAELLRGNELVTAWLRAPEFVIGDKRQWDQAAVAADHLRLLAADNKRRGIDSRTDQNMIRYYTTAAGGWLALLYSSEGSRRSSAVGPARQAIQRDTMWPMFSSSANNAERP